MRDISTTLNLIDKDLKILSIATRTRKEMLELIIEFEKSVQKNAKNIEQILANWVNKVNQKVMIWDDRVQRELRNLKVKKLYIDTLNSPKKILKGAQSFFNETI